MHRYDFDGRYLYGSPTLEGYRRQHRGHLRPEGSGASRRRSGAGGCRGSGPRAARRRPGRARTHRCHHPLRMRQPALHQLLAGRLRHPRHRRHVEAEARLRPRLVAAVPVPDPQRGAGAVRDQRPQDSGGRRRGRDSTCFPGRRPSSGSSTSPIEERPVPFATFQIDALDGTPQPQGHRLPPADREDHRHRDPGRLVRPRHAHHRHRPRRGRRARSRISCPIRRPAQSGPPATTCSWTSAG